MLRIEKYGPGSEKLSDAQLELLELEPGVSSAEVEAESERAQLKLPLKTARKHPGRQELPADLPRIEQFLACTPEQCVCGNCGKETTVIGYETAEQLDVEPAKYFVRVTKREKRACKACEEQGVQSAPLPPRIIEKGLASDRVVVDTVGKYLRTSSVARLLPSCATMSVEGSFIDQVILGAKEPGGCWTFVMRRVWSSYRNGMGVIKMAMRYLKEGKEGQVR